MANVLMKSIFPMFLEWICGCAENFLRTLLANRRPPQLEVVSSKSWSAWSSIVCAFCLALIRLKTLFEIDIWHEDTSPTDQGGLKLYQNRTTRNIYGTVKWLHPHDSFLEIRSLISARGCHVMQHLSRITGGSRTIVFLVRSANLVCNFAHLLWLMFNRIEDVFFFFAYRH